MSRLTHGEAFAPTQPLPDSQERLQAQRTWLKPLYLPNHVPFAHRLFYGIVSLTWLGWALIGLLSGHMFFLISRGGPIHFSGIPALIFSGAVLASAAACSIAVVDHCDKRDNEAAYKRLRRRLWFSAGGFFLLACIVGMAERADLLPYTDGKLGLMSAASLRSLLLSKWLASKLGTYKSALDTWGLITTIWCFAGLFAMSKLGLLKNGEQPRPVVVFVVIAVFVLPVLGTFTLYLTYSLAAGDIPPHRPMGEEEIRSRLAWMQSMLVSCLAVLGFCLGGLVTMALRGLGLIAPLGATKSDASSSS